MPKRESKEVASKPAAPRRSGRPKPELKVVVLNPQPHLPIPVIEWILEIAREEMAKQKQQRPPSDAG